MEPAARFQRAVSVTAMHGNKPKVQPHVIWILDQTITEILVPFEQHIASHIVISVLEFLLELLPLLWVPCIQYPVPE
ncbi:hypothetical protein JVT61DRAFT_6747 [Boletus reticuloceps]|uniref:Uncharacterized protein n=1 Tax=Boletus reticuloceps TaxID=495285 RepID=A0A8I2YKY2_9AGAM|nr:hypothetical protein JVT61DRAFT_6747 [Boletus reticuloceps]